MYVCFCCSDVSESHGGAIVLSLKGCVDRTSRMSVILIIMSCAYVHACCSQIMIVERLFKTSKPGALAYVRTSSYLARMPPMYAYALAAERQVCCIKPLKRSKL